MIQSLKQMMASLRLKGPSRQASSKTLAEEWRRLEKKLTRPSPVELPLGLHGRIMHRVKACENAPEEAKPIGCWLILRATSAALVVALAAALWPDSDASKSQQVVSLPAVPSLETELRLVRPDHLISPLSGELVMVEKDFRNAAAQVLSVLPDLATFTK